MMLVEETTVPTAALPVATFKDHMRLGSGFSDDGVQDALLESYLRAAIAAIEARTGKILIERSFSWTLIRWRDVRRQPLPVAPISAISHMTMIDSNGQEAAPDSGDWVLEPDQQRPSLCATQGLLPRIPQNGVMKLGFLAGYGPEWSDSPADLAQAVLLLATHYYDFRHDAALGTPALPFGVSALIEPYRTVRLLMGGRS